MDAVKDCKFAVMRARALSSSPQVFSPFKNEGYFNFYRCINFLIYLDVISNCISNTVNLEKLKDLYFGTKRVPPSLNLADQVK
jgi:hypothetical protein